MPSPRPPAALPVSPPQRLPAHAPLYAQIADGLLERIQSGELAPGNRLPPERELSEMLGVSRMTLRRALRRLEAQGLLRRRQGDGTYVSEPRFERQAGKLFSFTDGMRRRGYTPGARIIAFVQQPAEPAIASELGLAAAAPLYSIHRLRLVNQEPVMLERYLIPVDRFPGLERHDLAHRSMYEIMRVEYGVQISRARQSLEPVVAAAYEAGLLEIEVGAPLMLERRLSFDQHGQPVEHGQDLYRGDRFRFVTEMAPLEDT